MVRSPRVFFTSQAAIFPQADWQPPPRWPPCLSSCFMMADRAACCCAGHAVATRNMSADAADHRAFGATFGMRRGVNERE
ncbi:hypothetical protein QFZ39_002197 [Paraburkholderia graminis]|nr:hypothetical protein [Paraburkholderia graminis]